MSAPKAQWAIERRRQRKQKTKRERGGNLRSVLFVFCNRIVFADLRCTITGKISYAVSRCFSFMVSQEECGSHVAAVLDDDWKLTGRTSERRDRQGLPGRCERFIKRPMRSLRPYRFILRSSNALDLKILLKHHNWRRLFSAGDEGSTSNRRAKSQASFFAIWITVVWTKFMGLQGCHTFNDKTSHLKRSDYCH